MEDSGSILLAKEKTSAKVLSVGLRLACLSTRRPVLAWSEVGEGSSGQEHKITVRSWDSILSDEGHDH